MGSAVGYAGIITMLIIFLITLLVVYRLVKLAVNRSELKTDITKLRIEVKNLNEKINRMEKSAGE
ncbi:hypothetical protein [Paenibacillus solani]|uniref:Uncharacterized protein n=1 Tax=Paenibacillus solani TaxID=1705565 RepID=A0A0M1NKS4_9BACL|nr:hypothetical protein [Paenibacillus solani]KOR82469.1 hypothetical protein AM231_19325 [Paenibacillus solani]